MYNMIYSTVLSHVEQFRCFVINVGHLFHQHAPKTDDTMARDSLANTKICWTWMFLNIWGFPIYGESELDVYFNAFLKCLLMKTPSIDDGTRGTPMTQETYLVTSFWDGFLPVPGHSSDVAEGWFASFSPDMFIKHSMII